MLLVMVIQAHPLFSGTSRPKLINVFAIAMFLIGHDERERERETNEYKNLNKQTGLRERIEFTHLHSWGPTCSVVNLHHDLANK